MRVHKPESGYQTVRANGIDFAYFEEGEGPLVLMMHGFPDTAHTWDTIRPRVAAAGYRVVTPFLAGYAPSSIPVGDLYDNETLGKNVLALIEALDEERAILVGHDWGAGSVYSAVAQDQSKVIKLVTVAIPHPATIKPTLRKAWGVRHFLSLRLPGAVGRVAKNDYSGVDKLYARWSPSWDLPADELEYVKNAFSAPGCLNATLGYYRKLSPKPDAFMFTKIAVPTLVFAGLDDHLVTADDYARAGRMFTGSYRVESIPGGHFLHRESEDLFVEHTLDFLSS